MFLNPTKQKELYQKICRRICEFNKPRYNPDGSKIGADGGGMRERLWFAMALFESGDIDFANKIIEKSETPECHFAPAMSILLLLDCKDKMTKEAFEKLHNYTEKSMPDNLSFDMGFVGVNDNFPSMSTFALIIGGEYFNNELYVKKGIERLKEMCEMLTRRGFLSEYHSSTYTPIAINMMANIAEHAKNPEAKRLAYQAEERLWANLLALYHPEIYSFSGPFVRAYTVDSCGHTSQSHMLMYMLLGDEMKVNTLNTILLAAEGAEGEIIHGSRADFLQLHAAFMGKAVYHCPEKLAALITNRKYPFIIEGTSEFTSSNDFDEKTALLKFREEDMIYEYPAGETGIYAYMEQAFAMGTSIKDYHSGSQTDGFYILYKKSNSVQSLKDTGAVYARYLTDKKQFGTDVHSIEDDGRKLCLQEKKTSMVLYKPKLYTKNEVSELKLSLVFPSMYKKPEKIYVGQTEIKGYNEVFEKMDTIYASDGAIYMAFHPLVTGQTGDKAIEIKEEDGFLTISLYNYSGARKTFTKREISTMGNGFVCVVAEKNEYSSFEEFMTAQKSAVISDIFVETEHSRHTVSRKTTYEKGEIKLDCEYSPISEGIRYATQGGRPISRAKLRLGDLDVNMLPFM